MASVVIMRGLPGAGKSTWVRENLPDAVICSADSYFVNDEGEYIFDGTRLPEAHGECLRTFTETVSAIHAGDPAVVVVDNTGIRAWEISPYYNLARAYGHDVKIVHLQCDHEIAHGRNVHGVSKERVEQMDQSLDSEELPVFWNVEVVPG